MTSFLDSVGLNANRSAQQSTPSNWVTFYSGASHSASASNIGLIKEMSRQICHLFLVFFFFYQDHKILLENQQKACSPPWYDSNEDISSHVLIIKGIFFTKGTVYLFWGLSSQGWEMQVTLSQGKVGSCGSLVSRSGGVRGWVGHFLKNLETNLSHPQGQ